MQLTLAFVETKGFVGAVEAADAMSKTASIRIVKYTKIGDAYVTVLIEGELSDCQAAIESGAAAAERIGELVSSGIIPRPLEDLSLFISRKAKAKEQEVPVKAAATKKRAAKKEADTPSVPELIKKAAQGISIEELEKITQKSRDSIRQTLKKLMDDEKVEKIHKKYYWIT